MKSMIGALDIIFVTLDTLRYDVAQQLWTQGRLPTFSSFLPASGWERRHSPGSFTYAAHQSFFAGFLPTPAVPGPHKRLFALRFDGSESVGPDTAIFDSSTIVSGLESRGYHTICIGGTGFFNRASPLGTVLPGYFSESHWSPTLGVTAPSSTENQLRLAAKRLGAIDRETPIFLFINIGAMHQPNYFYCPNRSKEHGDDLRSHAWALEYVDSQFSLLLNAMKKRGPSILIVCSDHGTAYGEDGFNGHRLAHDVVWTVPYAEALIS